MDLQFPILLGAIAIVVVTYFSRRLGASAPLLLVLVGVLVSFLPWVGKIEVEPELILAGILPPLLYSGAVNIPAMGFRRDFRPIAGLSVLLVIVTAVSVGVLFSWIVPGIDLATGIALAAIVSPTDAVATTLVKRVGAPERVVTVLEGESLLNDASALVILRSSVAAIAGSVSLGWIALDFVWAVIAAVVIGFVVGEVTLRLRAQLDDPVLNTAISFVIPFLAYLPAEHLGASGLVAAVVAGLVFGQDAPSRLSPQERLAERANWRTVEFLLEGSIFLLMGLELSSLVGDLRDDGGNLMQALWLGLTGLFAVLGVRAIYLAILILEQRREREQQPAEREALLASQLRLEERASDWDALESFPRMPGVKRQHGRDVTPEMIEERIERLRRYFTVRIADLDYLIAEPIGRREGTLLVWAGMRGAVTLAAAQSLPRDTPQRALLVLIAFVVAAGSLLIQGGTLPWLTRKLGLSGATRDTGGRDERLALVGRLGDAMVAVCTDPGLRREEGSPFSPEILEKFCRERTNPAETLTDTSDAYEQFTDLRRQILHAQRAMVLKLRDDGVFSTSVLNDALAILDSDEISLGIREAAFNESNG